MPLSDEEKRTEEAAAAWAKVGANKNKIAASYTCKERFPAEENPVAIFMAGSPGAGKTETSIEMLKALDPQQRVVRIDADELRQFVPGYNGANSYLFHRAVSILVERILDKAFANKQSFILDGTLSKLDIAKKNIDRALRKKRFVVIVYVYMDPLLAWDFVQKRETVEGRRIEREVFIEQFFSAQTVVNQLKAIYGSKIRVMLFHKDIDRTVAYKDNISKIDSHIAQKYTRESLREALNKLDQGLDETR
ncbi:zeta toxin family protein [Bowmanella denitrificans]|uniref:zeta toxin family protein n=1 Tax=Bowmanella denitrificans TaxID=366582 RepID=UPI000C998E45|nr:zeta toxin family protein [Bowmanella denitrificans]